MRLIIALIAAMLAGCASSPPLKAPEPKASAPAGINPPSSSAAQTTPRKGAYYQDDGPGASPPPDLALIPDAEPRAEPYSRTANRPYNVFGMEFAPDTSDKPFKQRGMGSWYGRQFHGQKTASGEIYDMYAMTAAHPTLPIPSYAKVTNVVTGQSVIVRVNDRGPFLRERIMDLSYAAATRLGYVDQGTGMIEVERLLPHDILAGKFKPSPWVAQALPLNTSPAPSATAVAVRAPDSSGNSRLDPDIPADLRPDNVLTTGSLAAIGMASTSVTSAAANESLAAASAVSAATANVTPPLSLVPMSAPSPAAITTPILANAKAYLLQLAAFRTRAIADEFKQKVALELDATLATRLLIARALLPNGEWFRVQLGPYANRNLADAAAQTLRANVGNNYRPIIVSQP